MKRIAFIKDGKVVLVLNCDPKLLDAVLNSDTAVDATEADALLTKDWAFDGVAFTAPETVVE